MPLPFQITFRKDHLEACLLALGCDVMARERSNFESYSMCYEHVLEHARLKLCQKEQVCPPRSNGEGRGRDPGPLPSPLLHSEEESKTEGGERCFYVRTQGGWHALNFSSHWLIFSCWYSQPQRDGPSKRGLCGLEVSSGEYNKR